MGKKKLSDEEYEEIRRMYDDGVPIKDIAEKFERSKKTIRKIIDCEDYGRIVYLPNAKRRAGGITFEMIAEVRSRIRIGDRMIADVAETEKGKVKKYKRRCRVTGIYKHIFTVQIGRQTTAYKYVDLIMRSEIRYDTKRQSA